MYLEPEVSVETPGHVRLSLDHDRRYAELPRVSVETPGHVRLSREPRGLPAQRAEFQLRPLVMYD